jgi:hypothetical protein
LQGRKTFWSKDNQGISYEKNFFDWAEAFCTYPSKEINDGK